MCVCVCDRTNIYIYTYMFTYIQKKLTKEHFTGKHAISSLQLLFLQIIWNTIMKKNVHLFLLFFLKHRGNSSTTGKSLNWNDKYQQFWSLKGTFIIFFSCPLLYAWLFVFETFFLLSAKLCHRYRHFFPLKTSSTSQFLILRQ